MKTGKFLREWRKKAGLSQYDLAKKLKVTDAYVARIEGKWESKPSVKMFLRICKVLKIPASSYMQYIDTVRVVRKEGRKQNWDFVTYGCEGRGVVPRRPN